MMDHHVISTEEYQKSIYESAQAARNSSDYFTVRKYPETSLSPTHPMNDYLSKTNEFSTSTVYPPRLSMPYDLSLHVGEIRKDIPKEIELPPKPVEATAAIPIVVVPPPAAISDAAKEKSTPVLPKETPPVEIPNPPVGAQSTVG